MSQEREEGFIGQLLGERYRLDEVVGEGAMARIFRATDIRDGETVAIKLMMADLTADPEAVGRFKREAEILSRIDHPAIVSVRDTGQFEERQVFIAMELLEGASLRERMAAGRLSVEELTPIVTGIAVGLHAAHAVGVIHRDLKPDNVFLARQSGAAPRVKVLDFGIAKLYGSQQLTRPGQMLGTPRYMPPEQLRSSPELDQRVDVYGMGVIMFECLAGQPPFAAVRVQELILAITSGEHTPLAAYRPDLAEEVCQVVERAISKRPEHRYDSALELADAWMDAAARQRPSATAVTSAQVPDEHDAPDNRASIAPRPSRWRAAAAVVIALAIGAWILFRMVS